MLPHPHQKTFACLALLLPLSNMAPLTFSRLAEEYTGLNITQVNADEHYPLVERFGIDGFPAVLLVRGGVKVESYDGVKEEDDMLEWLSKAVPEMVPRPGLMKRHDRCYNVASAANGGHAESDGAQRNYMPDAAIDGAPALHPSFPLAPTFAQKNCEVPCF